MVVWNRWNLGWSDAFAQRYDANGAELGGELQLNTDAFSSAVATRVVATEPGSFVTAWHSDGYLGPPEEIFGHRLATPFFADDLESGVVCGWSAAVGSGDSCP